MRNRPCSASEALVSPTPLAMVFDRCQQNEVCVSEFVSCVSLFLCLFLCVRRYIACPCSCCSCYRSTAFRRGTMSNTCEPASTRGQTSARPTHPAIEKSEIADPASCTGSASVLAAADLAPAGGNG